MSINIRDIDVKRTWCLENTMNFTRFNFKEKTGSKFIVAKHHNIITNALDKVIKGDIKKLIINIAPRYSKTELVVKNFISYGLALNPKSKFLHLSYSDDLALDNSSEIMSTINSEYFKRHFNVNLTGKSTKKWYTSEGGGVYAVSTGGQVTGFGAGLVEPEKDKTDEEATIDEFIPAYDSEFAGAIIIDDPIKPDDAASETVREKVNNKFETTIRNRVNSRNTPIIIIMQRLHEDDLCGYLMKIEPDEWTVISLPCIETDDNGNEVALWEHKHTLEELRKIESANSFVFETQYMQNPKPLEGLMYTTFKEYDVIPYTKTNIRKNYTDTADTGSDYLCSICYVETEVGNYVTDILYTQKPMEFTEPKTAKMLTKNNTDVAIVESNNGGRGFARNVESQMRIMGNTKTFVHWFHQSENKQVRIFNKSADVQNITYYPKGWEQMFPEYARHIKSYRKAGRNKNDDAEDTVTGTVEWRGKNNIMQNSYTKEDLGIY